MKTGTRKLLAIVLTAVLTLGLLTACEAPAEGLAATYQDADGQTMQYWLYTPQGAHSGMPLIVYLHGGSGKGDDLSLLTGNDGLPQYLQQNRSAPSAYVLIPQLPEGCNGWADEKELLLKLISQVVKEYSIDSNCISLTGHSMGGTGVWQLALAYPNTFSAIAPLSGSVQVTPANVQKLCSLPVWAVVGSADQIVAPNTSIQMVQALKNAGGRARLSILDGAGHFDVPAFYLDEDAALLDWLAAQRRS